MTVNANDTVERYEVDGTGPYAFSFRIFAKSDLTVSVLEEDTEAATILTLDTHYTVADASVNDEDGGEVVLLSGAATSYDGYTLDIRSNTPLTQPTSITNQGPYSGASNETALDRLGRQIQDTNRKVLNALRVPDNENSETSLPSIADRASKFLRFDVNGEPEAATGIDQSQTLSQSVIGEYLNPRTAAEIAAGVTPTNYAYLELDARRYGFIGDANSTGTSGTDDTAAIQAAINVANAGFLGGSYGGGAGIVEIPAARFRYTGLTIKKGTSLRGKGSLNTIGFLVGTSATGLKCAAVDTDSSADQVTYGAFEDMSFASAEATPVAQVHWNAIGFSRWKLRNVLLTWCGGCTAIQATGANPASSGGPAQWYNELTNVELLHVGPNGGVGALLGESDSTYEGITTWVWFGGRATSNGTGTARNFQGANGCQSFSFVTEGCGTALIVGAASGARTSVSNIFVGDYFEGNTVNRDIKATAFGTRFIGCYTTGGTDSDLGTSTAFDEFGASADFKLYSGVRFGALSTDVTALDYYQEGTFVPAATFATAGDVAVTYGGSNAGSYTRIGNRVFFDIDLHVTDMDFTTASGDFRITGLPYAAGATSSVVVGFQSININWDAGQTMLSAQTAAGQSYLSLIQNGDAIAADAIAVANLTTNNPLRLQISGSYRV